MAQSQSWSSRNTSRTSIGASEAEALRARAEQEKQLRDLERRDKIEGLKDYKEKSELGTSKSPLDEVVNCRKRLSL